uniref:Uncharacterized protein n=1 Tax=Panagrolaimus sp. JU765 TaxID=591449 RepID=A0AC34R467_9BILA
MLRCRLAVAGVASKNYFDTNSTNSSQKRPANTRANDDGVQVKKPTLDRPGKLALYRANLNKLPTNLKKAIQDAQKKFCLSQKLDDVVPALKDAIPHNPQVFIGFREFLSDDRHSEFDAILRQHGL